MTALIRNFCIIAHIDHGKSTLADRLLEVTGTISKREMKDQLLDQMDLERERGITIKLQPVRMDCQIHNQQYVLNLIDTPGHVDFHYEVSRSLAAVEGALLLVDATQGIQAQTLANLYLALEQNLAIIPIINKIDLPGARVEDVSEEIIGVLGCDIEDIVKVSAKTGEGVSGLLEEIVKRVPAPKQSEQHAFRALIFDSVYDEYRGVVAYVRVVDGEIRKNAPMMFKATVARGQVLEVGYFKPKFLPADVLSPGEIGYIVTGLKSVHDCRVGDTIVSTTEAEHLPALAGYAEVKPMVFAGLFPRDGDDFKRLRDAVEKLRANDAAFTFEPEHSPALGFGFRCGFLGLLHLEIIQERLRREYGLDAIVTVPSVAYKLISPDEEVRIIKSPLEYEDNANIYTLQEPWITADIIAPESALGSIMSLAAEKRGIYINTEYLKTERGDSRRVLMHFQLPLSSILVDFYDKLKSVSAGYASLNYEVFEYRDADVVRLDITVADDRVDALCSLVYRDQAYAIGRKVVESLKKLIPRQQFEVKIQASIGSKVIASERISAFRKDVTAGLYGGDVTRKQKLLRKQKEGKKRMKTGGKVEIPTEAYLSILKR